MRAHDTKRIIELVSIISLAAVSIIVVNYTLNITSKFVALVLAENPIMSTVLVLMSIVLFGYIMFKFIKSEYYQKLYVSNLVKTSPVTLSTLSLLLFAFVYQVNFTIIPESIFSLVIFLAEFISFTIFVAVAIEAIVYIWNHLSKNHQIHIGNNFDHTLHF